MGQSFGLGETKLRRNGQILTDLASQKMPQRST